MQVLPFIAGSNYRNKQMKEGPVDHSNFSQLFDLKGQINIAYQKKILEYKLKQNEFLENKKY